nr:TonB-dependent receptor [Rhodohalobacter sulfatireducens]
MLFVHQKKYFRVIRNQIQKIGGFLFLVIIFLNSTDAISQSKTIRGIITDASTGQTIQGANIVLFDQGDNQVKGTVSDRNGFYRLQNISADEYRIRISYIGFITKTDTLNIAENEEITTYSTSLRVNSAELDELVVSVESEAAQLKGGHQRVSAIDLNRVVTPAGSGDIANYLQALPGVVSAGDRGGQLFVRGGTPSENLVLIDGLTIYQPFHIIGFFSAFPENLLANADFYAGGFSPKYNGRISSVLDVQMRDGDVNNTNSSVSISPFLTEIQMEGPLGDGNNSSWIASVRSSQIEQTSDLFLGKTQPLRFDSQFLKFTRFNEDGTRCSAMAMRTYDRGKLDFDMGNSFSWSNFVLGGKCTHLPQESNTFVDFNFGLSHLSNKIGGSLETNLSSALTKFSLDLDINQTVGNVKLNYGVNSHMKWINYNIEELFQIPQSETDILLGLGSFTEAEIPLGEKITVRPGASLSFYANTYNPSIEPRLRFSWQPFGNDNQELNASIGIYRQTIAGISDLRDAGSAFIAWLPTPNDERMEAIHSLVGWQQQLGSGLQFSAEGYYKKLQNIPVSVWSTIAEFTTDIAFANGDIWGADVRLEYNHRLFYAFLGYGYSWTKYRSAQENFNVWFGSPIQSYHPGHDRRHQINSMVSAYLGKYTVGLRWQMGTGLPFTRQMGSDGIFLYEDGLPNVRTDYGTPRVILDKPFKGRTPIYHRLDVSLEREFEVGFGTLFAQAGAINTYNRTNLFYYDVFTQRRINQLPFAPYASLKMEF